MLDDEYNKLRCANTIVAPLRGQATVVGRRELGPRDQKEQRTRRASFLVTYHIYGSAHSSKQQSVIVLGSEAWLKRISREEASAIIFAARLESVSAGSNA